MICPQRIVKQRALVRSETQDRRGEDGNENGLVWQAVEISGGVDGTRTRDPRRDRPVF